MPTTIKSSSNISKLGDLSTYSIATSAIPYDTSDTSGAVPTVNVTMADGTDSDYLIGETLTLQNQGIGNYTGEIVDLSNSSNSGRYTMSAETIISRLNSDQRLYPSQGKSAPVTFLPIVALEYWSQQCGIFYDNVPGDVLYYQSNFGHWFSFVKGSTRPIRGLNYVTAGSSGTNVSDEAILGDRYVTSFGQNRDLSVTFRKGEPLPVLIPAASDPRVAVFSSGVMNQGTGRAGTITWDFTAANGAAVSLRARIDNLNGISVELGSAGTFTSILSVPSAIADNYRLNIGVTAQSSTTAQITLNVIGLTGALIGTQSGTFTTALLGSLSLTKITHTGVDQGTGEQILHWGDSISIMDSMPTKRYEVQKSLTAGVKKAQYFAGFSGNVWENFKAYCSIFHLDVSCANGKLTIGPRQTDTTPINSPGAVSKRVNKRDQARFVEVVCQNSALTVTGSSVSPLVLWKADTVYQVAVGETQTFTVQTDHSILDLQQPVAVSGINPYPYKTGTGQYVVTGSDGYIVSPSFWRDQGGSITVDTTDNDGEIKVTIQGPAFDSPRAPYRISEGDAGRPALYITGQGVLNTPTTIRVSTGNTKAAKEVGVTLDCPFISNIALAYDAAARASRKFATPDVQVTMIEALDYDSPSDLGVAPAGQLVKRDGNILRVTDATQAPATLNTTGTQHNTIKQVKKSFGTGTTIGQAKAFYAGKTIGQVNLKPLKVVK